MFALRFQIQKLKGGGYLATGYGEFENIIVQAKTLPKLRKSVANCLSGYFQAFPESIDFVLKKRDR